MRAYQLKHPLIEIELVVAKNRPSLRERIPALHAPWKKAPSARPNYGASRALRGEMISETGAIRE
jgi:hypothetical protein